MTTARLILPGTFNSREIAGVSAADGTVRPGMILRSDAPVGDRDGLRDAVVRLGIRTTLDLRQPVERELDPVDLGELGIDVRHVPALGEDFDLRTPMTLEAVYRELLDRRGHNLTAAVRVLAEPGALPAIVFCSAGKDRTGLVTALTLEAIGVPEEEIVADYARSEQNMKGPFRAAIEARARAAGISEQELAVKVGAPPVLIRRTLAWLRERHGGASRYLLSHSMTRDELGALRRELVGPAATAA